MDIVERFEALVSQPINFLRALPMTLDWEQR